MSRDGTREPSLVRELEELRRRVTAMEKAAANPSPTFSTVSAALTGNVTGNVTGDVTGDVNGGAVTLDSLTWTGQSGASSGVVKSWSPSWTNFTPGNGTFTGNYVQLGQLCFWWFQFEWGSTSSWGSNPRIDYPVPAQSTRLFNASFVFEDASGADYLGQGFRFNSNQIYIRMHNSSSTYVSSAAPSNSTPFTWASGDFVTGSGFHAI